uniref:Uncharacterized protein n=1 Tax=Rhizophora mucronata TaxID=61149 RepID=A0A2P2N867_RHIMU
MSFLLYASPWFFSVAITVAFCYV